MESVKRPRPPLRGGDSSERITPAPGSSTIIGKRPGRVGREVSGLVFGPGSAPSRKVNAMHWRHLCLVRAVAASGLLTCSMLGASAAGEPQEPIPGADAQAETVKVLDA